MKRILLLAAVAGLSMVITSAQDEPKHDDHPAGNPLFAALDTNHDGELDATEISNAPAALRKLDKNGDGRLTRQELRGSAAKKADKGETKADRKAKKAEKK